MDASCLRGICPVRFRSSRGEVEVSQVPGESMACMPCSLTPAKPGLLVWAEIRCCLPGVIRRRPSRMICLEARSHGLHASLSTLRSRGRPRATQDSLPVGDQPCPDGARYPQDSTEGFGFQVIVLLLQALPGAHHIHLLCEATDRAALSRGMQGLCVRIARGLNRMWRRAGSLFENRYHARDLKCPREVRAALNYLFHNARHHGIRLAHAFDPCTSARWFDGWSAGAHKDGRLASASSPLARARTWLLAIGWRRWGLIDPA